MKKIFSLAVVACMALAAWAQQPVITFEKETHDFGQINEVDGRVTTIFTFKNEGMAPLVLSDVRASCGCTTPKWPHEPVEPGQTGEITVTYNPNGRPGRFQKTITVTSNAASATTRLFIKGEVIPKTAKPVDHYPVKMGAVGLKANMVDFGSVTRGIRTERVIEYANLTKDTLKLSVLVAEPFVYASASIEKAEVEVLPQAKGQLHFVILENCEAYGPMELKAYVVINGQETRSDEFAVTLKADMQEDFSALTEQQLADAPIADVNGNINLGTFVAGKKGSASFHVANVGTDVLMVRRVVSDDPNISVKSPKSIKSGKKGTFTVAVTSKEAGSYTSEITLITNDPKSPVKHLTLNWTVEK